MHVRCCNAPVSRNTTITYASPRETGGQRDPELFATNLAALGLQLDIQVIDFATYIDLSFGDLPAEERPNLFSFFWSPDYNDAWNHLWPQVSCAAWQAGNVGQYCNSRVEALLEEAKSPPTRRAISRRWRRSSKSSLATIRPRSTSLRPSGRPCRRDLAGFDLNLIAPEIIDFYQLNRAPTS